MENPSYCEPQGEGNNRVTNRGDPNNREVITNHIIVDNTKSTTNYTNVVTNNVDPDNEVITNLSITATLIMGLTLFQPPLLMLALTVLLLSTWSREGTTWTSTWQGFQSTWQGFLDNFEVKDGMTEVAKREFRDQATQISRPRIEGAESSRPSRETTNLGQPGPRIFTAATSNTTSAATPTVRMTAASERMLPPTTTTQPHWATSTKPTPKDKELENKPVQGPNSQGLPGEGHEKSLVRLQ